MILGIDPGMHHCGVCVYDPQKDTVAWWAVRSFDMDSASVFRRSFEEVVCEMDAVVPHHLIDTVAIERQPPKNAQMLKMQHYLEMTVACLWPHVTVCVKITPQRRLKYVRENSTVPLDTSTYGARKKASVAFVESWSRERDVAMPLARKTDDACEALLVALVASTLL